MRAPRLKTSKLVIGYSLEALEFASAERAMIILNEEHKPHELHHPAKFKSWNQLSFHLGMAGLIPLPSAVDTIRIESQVAHVSTEHYRKIMIEFEELYLFDLDRVEGLPVKEEITEYIVYDWFDIKRGAKQASCRILGSTSFVNQLVFYPSLRRDGNTGNIKDCYTISYITPPEMESFSSSHTAARLAAMSMIKSAGLRGPPRTVNDKTHYLNLILEHARRDIYKHRKKITHQGLPEYVYCCNISK